MQKWRITYTLDSGVTTQSIEVLADTFTNAVLESLKVLPKSCFVGSDTTSAILSVEICQSVSK